MWFSTIFEVVNYEYDNATAPGMPGAWGAIYQRRLQEFFYKSKRNRLKFFPGVFEGTDYICDCPRSRYNRCPG